MNTGKGHATRVRLHVLEWQERYETAETKKLRNLNWVPVPNRMDTTGYSALMSHPNGLAHFGAWIAILEICSRGKGTENRGFFDCPPYYAGVPGESAGLPAALAGVSRGSPEVFSEALQRLETLGWIKIELIGEIKEQVQQIQSPTEVPGESAGVPGESAGRREGNRREGKGTEQEGTASPPPLPPGYAMDEQYAEFRALYLTHRPDRVDEDFQGFAWTKWRKLDGLQKQARINGLKERIGRGDDPAFFDKPEVMIDSGYKRGERPPPKPQARDGDGTDWKAVMELAAKGKRMQ